jgi:hypothetical protein
MDRSAERVAAAFTGETPLSELTADEGAVFNAEVVTRIQERLARLDLGQMHAAMGITTVALDKQGRLVEYHPDGSTNVIGSLG